MYIAFKAPMMYTINYIRRCFFMFSKATQNQLEIIKDTEGYQRILAVPGSGKTFCIVNRMAYLITEMYVDPKSVHAITFTNKAARQMTNRLKELVGDKSTCFTGTFHGKCNEILKEEIHKLGYPKTFSILDKNDQIDLVRLIAEEQGISLKDHTAKEYMDEIALKKQEMDYVEEFMSSPDKTKLNKEVAMAFDDVDKIYYNYLLKQKDNYVLDFNDLIIYTLHIFMKYPDVLKKWQDKCQYVLCDEYQDVNFNQDRLLNLLSKKYGNLTVVGDDDQCIYGWRGSKVDFMVCFHENYPNVKDHCLDQNFRSTPQIIELANSLIESNKNRLNKKMFTGNEEGPKPVYNGLKSDKEEALWIADVIQSKVQSGKRYSNHSILVRASTQTRALEEAFIEKGVPYKILGGASFYGSEEIRTVFAYLRMVYSLNDLDFEWTIKRPKKGYGKKSVERLKQYALSRNMSLIEALGDQIDKGLVKKQDLIDYYNGLTDLHRNHTGYSCVDIVNKALDIGYREELQSDVDQTRIDNVTELIVTITALEKENGVKLGLDELLAHFALFTNQDDDSEKDVAKIMTIHTAKGLEFDTVFVSGLVEGQFPSKKLKNQDELEEERRLFYVAITRAKKELYLSSYELKAGSFAGRQSSFMADMDVNCLDCINGSRIFGKKRVSEILPKSSFAVGDKVKHPGFGNGTIENVDEAGQTYDINFETLSGIRRIQFRAPLEKI